jgi:cobalt/nickel transport system ATP-binding protein
MRRDAGHSTTSPALHFDGVVFVYPDGTAALAGVDLEVDRGESVALLGPNGAGKSTLMLHTNGLLRAAAGSVSVAGVTVDKGTLEDVRSRVGLVFQDPDDQLFMTTVYDDVAFGPLNMGLPAAEVEQRVHDALEAVGLTHVSTRPPQHLSFGQRKRAALATVLAMGSEMLVLDEPTSNLDPRARRGMIELLGSLEATMLVATHDMEVAWRLCERSVILDEGRVAADGPSRQVLADEALLLAHGLELPPNLTSHDR